MSIHFRFQDDERRIESGRNGTTGCLVNAQHREGGGKIDQVEKSSWKEKETITKHRPTTTLGHGTIAGLYNSIDSLKLRERVAASDCLWTVRGLEVD